MARQSPSEPASRHVSNVLDRDNVIVSFKLTTKDFRKSVVENSGGSIMLNDSMAGLRSSIVRFTQYEFCYGRKSFQT